MRSDAGQAFPTVPIDDRTCDAAELARSCEAGTPTFVLVDPMAGEPIAVEMEPATESLAAITAARSSAWCRDVQAIELPARIDLPPSLFPYLVPLSGSDDEWLTETLAIAHADRLAAQSQGIAGQGKAAQRIGAWIHASAFADAVAATISDCLRVRCERGSPLRYQRLADGRVMHWAAHVAGDAAVGAALGPIQRWTFLSATGRLCEVRGSQKAAVALQWTTEQMHRFMMGELAHGATARYLGELSLRGLALPMPENTLLSRVEAALQRAQAMAAALGLKAFESQDWTALAALLLLHPEQAVERSCRQALTAPEAESAGSPAQPGSGPVSSPVSLHDLAPHLNDLLFASTL